MYHQLDPGGTLSICTSAVGGLLSLPPLLVKLLWIYLGYPPSSAATSMASVCGLLVLRSVFFALDGTAAEVAAHTCSHFPFPLHQTQQSHSPQSQ
jgi:hypothetical protein